MIDPTIYLFEVGDASSVIICFPSDTISSLFFLYRIWSDTNGYDGRKIDFRAPEFWRNPALDSIETDWIRRSESSTYV